MYTVGRLLGPRPGSLSEGAVSRRLTEGVIPEQLNSHEEL